MSESRPSWSRYLAEAVTIVASILIAFGLDAWWDGHSERRVLEGQLRVVIAEMERARAELAHAALSSPIYADLTDAVLDRLDATSVGGTASVPDTALAGLLSYYVMDIPTRATDRFIESGGLEIIRDPAIVAELNAWTGIMQDAVDDGAQARFEFQTLLMPVLASAADLRSPSDRVANTLQRAFARARGEAVPEWDGDPEDVPVVVTVELINHLLGRSIQYRNVGAGAAALVERQDALIAALREEATR